MNPINLLLDILERNWGKNRALSACCGNSCSNSSSTSVTSLQLISSRNVFGTFWLFFFFFRTCPSYFPKYEIWFNFPKYKISFQSLVTYYEWMKMSTHVNEFSLFLIPWVSSDRRIASMIQSHQVCLLLHILSFTFSSHCGKKWLAIHACCNHKGYLHNRFVLGVSKTNLNAISELSVFMVNMTF